MVYLILVYVLMALIFVFFKYRAERKEYTLRIANLRARLDLAGTSRATLDAEWQKEYRAVESERSKGAAENLNLRKQLDRQTEDLAEFRKDREALLGRIRALDGWAKALEGRVKRLTVAKKRASIRGRRTR